MSGPGDDITGLLLAWGAGSEPAGERLLDLVYQELRRVAGAQLRRERREHTLQPTALVNEVYCRLVDQRRVQWHNRAQFFAIAARLMRRVLVDHARRRNAAKRGGAAPRIAVQDVVAAADAAALVDPRAAADAGLDVVALDDALVALARTDERLARLVELRYFAGFDIDETAQALGVSPATVKRQWALARAFLFRELARGR